MPLYCVGVTKTQAHALQQKFRQSRTELLAIKVNVKINVIRCQLKVRCDTDV